MQTNGVSVNEPRLTARPLAAIAAEPKQPTIWGDALKQMRTAKGWSPRDLINHAARDATMKQVQQWERGDAHPSARHMDLLRKFVPGLRAFDDMLPPGLRADPKAKSKIVDIEPIAAPTGWRGPRVTTFAQALRFCREQQGMSGIALAKSVGVTQSSISRWELGRGGDEGRMIQEVYQKLCDLLPMLEHGPKPEFSTRFSNQIKTAKYVEAQDALSDAARAKRHAELVIRAHEEKKAAAVAVDAAPVNMAGAHYGVLKADLYQLQAKRVKLESEHRIAMERLAAEIAEKERALKEADEGIMKAATDAHGVSL